MINFMVCSLYLNIAVKTDHLSLYYVIYNPVTNPIHYYNESESYIWQWSDAC